MKHLVVVLFLLASQHSPCLAQNQATIDNARKFDDARFSLVQNLLSCHSLATEMARGASDNRKRLFLDVGSHCYNRAHKAFVSLQVLNENMDAQLRENISTMLELYSKCFGHIDSMNDPGTVLALPFGKAILKDIVSDLY